MNADVGGYVWYRLAGHRAHARIVRGGRYYGLCGRPIDELRAAVAVTQNHSCLTCLRLARSCEDGADR